jgi:uncharacterized peroxidase-related enzyme
MVLLPCGAGHYSRRVPYIKVPDNLPGIVALLAFRPDVARPLAELTDILLHRSNSLTPGERELIAAYVSALNDCSFCYASHAATAACHLADEALVDTAIRDPESATISSKLKALLAIAAQVQRGGQSVREADIARARVEGATDLEIHDTVLIAAAFCMFNRYVDGLATRTPSDPHGYRERARQLAQHGYSASLPAREPT